MGVRFGEGKGYGEKERPADKEHSLLFHSLALPLSLSVWSDLGLSGSNSVLGTTLFYHAWVSMFQIQFNASSTPQKVGNVYVQFREEEHDQAALQKFTGRFYAGFHLKTKYFIRMHSRPCLESEIGGDGKTQEDGHRSDAQTRRRTEQHHQRSRGFMDP